MRSISDQKIIEVMRAKNFKVTPQRIAICRAVLSSKEHPSPKRIFEEVRKAYPTVSLATVYKTLKMLNSLGLIQELIYIGDETRVDSNIKLHFNLICNHCLGIEDVEEESLSKQIRWMSVDRGSLSSVIRIDVHGVCRKCSSEKDRVANR